MGRSNGIEISALIKTLCYHKHSLEIQDTLHNFLSYLLGGLGEGIKLSVPFPLLMPIWELKYSTSFVP